MPEDIGLMAHLLRRAGFGATREELATYAAKGYEATVEELLYPERSPDLEYDLLERYMEEWHDRSATDALPHYVMLYNGTMAPGAVSHPDGGGHSHSWEHVVYILEGHGTLFCDGKEYTVAEGDAVLVPPNAFHQWRNTSDLPLKRVTFNPLVAEGHGG
jgi:quercetin dioxygenase-like cupin family protein